MDIDRKLPKSALALYVKLYCEKRSVAKAKINNVLAEATKSWLTLSKSEKQQFLNKYCEYKKNVKNAFAEHLKKAEPYLKKKETRNSVSLVKYIDNSILEDVTQIYKEKMKEMKKFIDNLQESNANVDNRKISEEVESNTVQQEVSPELEDTELNHTGVGEPINSFNIVDENAQFCGENLSSNSIRHNEDVLLEPVPPKLIYGRQLYNMINPNKLITWEMLPGKEKRYYQNAVLKIKKDYLKNYKIYLEQLSSENLYYYHRNII